MSDASPDELLGQQVADADAPPSSSGDFTADDNVILPSGESGTTIPKPAKPSAIDVHDPATSRSWWIPGGMLVAAAAAIAVWWVWPPNEDVRGATGTGELVAQPDPLPSYVLETDSGLEPRGDTGDSPDAAALRYRRTNTFEWILRPASGSGGEVGVRGFALVDGGSAGLPLDLSALVKIAESGAIRISGEIVQLGLEPGRYTIALVVGRPSALPEQADALTSEVSDAWVVHRVELEILE